MSGAIHFVEINTTELSRLKKAKQMHKYGHLESWKELYLYQRTVADREQNLEIAALAKRKNRGENITLPLMNWMKQASFYEPAR